MLSPDALATIFETLEKSLNLDFSRSTRILYEIAKISPNIDLSLRCMTKEVKNNIKNILLIIEQKKIKKRNYIKNKFTTYTQ